MREYPKNRWVAGTYKRECDICGWDYLRSEMLKTWDNLIVCRKDYEPKHTRLLNRSRLKERPFRQD